MINANFSAYSIEKSSDIKVVSKHVESVEKLILWYDINKNNIDYINEFKKYNLYIDQDIALNIVFFNSGMTFDFSKILNVDKVHSLYLPLIYTENSKQFKNLKNITVSYVMQCNIIRLISNYNDFKLLETITILEPYYNEYYLKRYESKNELNKLFENNNLKSIKINKSVFYRPLLTDEEYVMVNDINTNIQNLNF